MANTKIHIARFLVASALYLGAGAALAATAVTAAGGATAAPAGTVSAGSGSDLRHAQRAGEQFGAFAGSRENTEALALSLRRGSEVTLTGADGKTTTFTPATGHMGHGNVTKSMALAQRQLAAAGINNPTPEQLKAALNGGTVTTGTGADAKTVEMQGILKLRSEGMGWGKIAHTVGVKPGHGFKPMPVASTTGGVTSAQGGQRPGRHEHAREHRHDGRGVVTAGGSGRHGAHHTNGAEPREVEDGVHQHRGGRGMVTAAGGAPAQRAGGTEVHKGGGAEAVHRQGGRGAGSGIVTATGAPAAGVRPARGGEVEVHRSSGSHGGSRAAGGAIVSAAGGSTVATASGSGSGGGHGNGRGGGHGGGKN